MPGFIDYLDQIAHGIQAHPGAEELLSIVPAVAGAALQARQGGRTRIGAPLGAGLSALGGFGLEQGLKNQTSAAAALKNAKLSALLSKVTPQTKLTDLLAEGTKQGLDPADVIMGYQAMVPPPKSAEILKVAGQVPGEIINGKFTPIAGAPKLPGLPEKAPSPFEEFVKENPNLTPLQAKAEWEKAGREPEKPPAPTIVYADGKMYGVNPRTLPPLPAGMIGTRTAPKPPKPATSKSSTALTPIQKAGLVRDAFAQAKTELTTTGYLGARVPNGGDVKKRAVQILMARGYDANGNPLPVGTKTTY